MPNLSNTYDPYRNAVRQTLQDKATEKRKQSFTRKEKREKAKSFFQKKIYLRDYIDLPEGLVNIIFLGFFLLIPYTIGVLFTFTFLADLSLLTYKDMHNSFAFLWVLGYELVASLLLLLIIKSSINFELE